MTVNDVVDGCSGVVVGNGVAVDSGTAVAVVGAVVTIIVSTNAAITSNTTVIMGSNGARANNEVPVVCVDRSSCTSGIPNVFRTQSIEKEISSVPVMPTTTVE